MWLMNYITKNSITAPKAEKGGVKSSGNTVSVDSSEEHRGIKCCVPYGFASVVPVGESAVVLPLANGEVSLGVLAKNVELDEGEVMLSSKGGASIVLKNEAGFLSTARRCSMRDTMIKNGDIVIGSSGNTVLLEGSDAKFQQAVLCISAKLGGFVYDRDFGSKVLLQDKTLSAKQTELLANESLAKMKNTYASVKSVGRQITIDLTVDDITREVQINGNL